MAIEEDRSGRHEEFEERKAGAELVDKEGGRGESAQFGREEGYLED